MTRHVLSGGGICGQVARDTDWSLTALGPVESWPQSLRTTVSILLNSRHPMFLWWGPELVQLYNDAYLPSFGVGKHPAAMGQPGRLCWQEIWPIISPQIEDVMQRGKASWNEDHLVPIFRNGRIEEVYWTYGYSPVLDESGAVGGTLVVCTETTGRVVAARRLAFTRALALALAEQEDAAQLQRVAAECLGSVPRDVPFAVVRARGAPPVVVGVESASGIPAYDGPAQERALPQPIQAGPWPEPVSAVFAGKFEGGVEIEISFGLSPRLTFDHDYHSFLRQIAELIAAAEARVLARQTLEQAHGERGKLLQAAQSAARAKDEFLAMLGHELRNPLAPILTALQLMKAKGIEQTAREQAIIERQATHLVHLVDDLLDVSRVAEGKIQLKKQRVPLSQVVARAVEVASPLLESRGHALELSVPRVGFDVDADVVRLTQVVANLLTNAARYTASGGKISVVASHDDGRIVLRVADNGSGIAPSQLPHLFEAFFQGHRQRDRAEGGLGLGLALVKSLVELHGGEASAHSEGLGKGSMFELRLPPAVLSAERGEPIDDRELELSSQPTFPASRVLLVDDNADIAELFSALLRAVGFEVETASDGPSALEIASKFRPAVAVLDIGLPVMDGYELAQRLRELLADAPPRLIAVSGYGQQEDKAHSARAGFHQHLVKPVDARSLVDAIGGPSEATAQPH